MKKYREPIIDILVIDIEDDINAAPVGQESDINYQDHIIGGGIAEIIDNGLVNDRGYNNDGF